MKDMIIYIYNIYLLLPGALWNINKKFFIYYLQQALSKPGKYLLIKDFNIYHFIWGGARYIQWHNIINNLI